MPHADTTPRAPAATPSFTVALCGFLGTTFAATTMMFLASAL